MRNIYNRGLTLSSGLVRYSLLGFVWLSCLVAYGQNNPANYRFSVINQTYTELNSATDTEIKNGSTDDDIWYAGPGLQSTQGATPFSGPGFPIGFNFTYGTNVCTHFGVNSNGYIILATASPNSFAGTYSRPGVLALKDVAYGSNLLATWATDLQLQTSSRISYQLQGTAPNRVCVVQFKGIRHYGGTGEDLNFQIQLYETSNEIIFHYGNLLSTSTGRVIQIGLKGTDSTEVSSLEMSGGFAAPTRSNFAQTAFTTSGTFVPSSGQGYKWAPPRPPVPNDLGVLSIISPRQDPNACALPANTNIRVRIFNHGNNAISSTNVAYRVNGGPEVVETVNFTNPLSPTQSRDYTFTQGFNGSAVGNYRIIAYTKLANDTADDNDSAKNSVRVDNGRLLPLDPANNLAEAQRIGWRRFSGVNRPAVPTPNTFSGWVSDFTLVNEAYSVEFITTNDSVAAWLVSPKVDVQENAYLAFRLKAQRTFGGALQRMGNKDTLKVVASYDCGQTWNTLRNYTRADLGTVTGFGNNSYVNQEVMLSTTPGQSVIAALYAVRWDTSAISYEIVADSAIIFVKPANDMGVSRLISPNSNTNDYCNLTANEDVRFEIKNTGLNPRTSAVVGYRIDNDAEVTQTINFSPALQQEQTFTVSFPNVNLANRTNFRMRVWVKATPDGVLRNDTVDQRFNLVDRTPVRLRYGTNFDSTTFTMPAGWSTIRGSITPQSGHGTGTPSSYGMTTNIYSSNSLVIQNIRPIGPIVDSFSTLTFDYRMMNWSGFFSNPTPFAPTAGDSIVFYATTDCGLTWDRLYKITNANHTTSNQFFEVKVSLKKFVGKSMAIQWRGYWGGLTTSDFYFEMDNFMMERNPERDLAVRNLISPSRSLLNCGYTNAEPVIVEVRNNGRVQISTFDASYRVNNGPVVNETFNLATPLDPGDTRRITFTQTANIAASGTYRFFIRSVYAADSASFNDTLGGNVTNSAPAPVPNRVIFDTSRGDLPRFWDTPNIADVFIETGHGRNRDGLAMFLPTGNQVRSFTTGVYGLTTTANMGARFIYRIAKSANYANDVHILGPNDSIRIDVSTNCGVTFLNRMVIKAANQNRSINFDSVAVPANVPVGSKLMYRVIVASSTGDFYVDFDEFKLLDLPGVDLSLSGISKPNNNYGGCTPTATEPVEVIIANQGANPISTAEVEVRLNNAFAFTQTVNFTPALNPGTARAVPLNQTLNLLTPANYRVSAVVTAIGDLNKRNDSSFTVVNVLGQVTTYPNTNNFSDPVSGWQQAAGNSTASWRHIQGSTTLGLGASPPRISPAQGIGMYVFPAHELPTGATARLNTRCFDFSNITAGAGDTLTLQFAYSRTGNIGANIDSLFVSYTTNGGASYTQLGAYSRLDPTLGVGGAGWRTINMDISALAGLSSVRFSFLGVGRNSNGIALDFMNVRVASNNAFIQFANLVNPDMASSTGAINFTHDSVDVYINGVKVVDNLGYRQSTPFIKRTPGALTIAYAPKGNTSLNSPNPPILQVNQPLTAVKDRYYVLSLLGGGLNTFGNRRNPVYTQAILSNARIASVQANDVDMNFINAVPDQDITRFTQVGPNGPRVALSNAGGISYPSPSTAYSSLPSQVASYFIGESGAAAGSPITWQYEFQTANLANKAVVFYLNGMNNLRGAPNLFQKSLCYSLPEGGNMVCLAKTSSVAPRIKMDFDVYPNPSTGVFGLKTSFAGVFNSRIEVVNLVGQVVYSENLGMVSDLNREINLSHLKSGSYLFRMVQGEVSDYRQIVITK